MTFKSKIVIAGVLASSMFGVALQPVLADEAREVMVRTHPSQGDVTQIQNAMARLTSDADGIFVSLKTSGLDEGHVYSMLFVVMNDPQACPKIPCTPKDVLTRSDEVGADIIVVDGVIADASGTASFAHFQPYGPFENGFFTSGLQGAEGIELHLILNDHGPLIEGRAFDMLNSYRDGCSDDSIPGPMPATARSQGNAGPNQCRMVQFAQFLPIVPSSS